MKYKINATQQQLENIGISYNLSGLIGTLKNKYPTGWYCLTVKHKVGKINFTNDFDIPKTFLSALANER